MNTSKRVKMAERSLITENSKCRWMNFAWALMLLIGVSIVGAGVFLEPEALILFCVYLPVLGGAVYASVSEDGVYTKRRDARWRLEDLREEASEEIVRSFT